MRIGATTHLPAFGECHVAASRPQTPTQMQGVSAEADRPAGARRNTSARSPLPGLPARCRRRACTAPRLRPGSFSGSSPCASRRRSRSSRSLLRPVDRFIATRSENEQIGASTPSMRLTSARARTAPNGAGSSCSDGMSTRQCGVRSASTPPAASFATRSGVPSGFVACQRSRAVGVRGVPTLDETLEPREVVAIHRDRRVDVLGGAYRSVADDRQSTDDDVTDAGAIEIAKRGGEVVQRCSHRSIATLLSATPSSRRSWGSRSASSIRTYRRHASFAAA